MPDLSHFADDPHATVGGEGVGLHSPRVLEMLGSWQWWLKTCGGLLVVLGLFSCGVKAVFLLREYSAFGDAALSSVVIGAVVHAVGNVLMAVLPGLLLVRAGRQLSRYLQTDDAEELAAGFRS